MPTTLPLRLDPSAILKYLDTSICTWSAIKNQYSEELWCKLLPKAVLETTIADFYLSAFQSVRTELFGHPLSKEDIAKAEVPQETIERMGVGGTFKRDGDALLITNVNGIVSRYEPAKSKSTKAKKR